MITSSSEKRSKVSMRSKVEGLLLEELINA